ncbi:DUF3617 domain-containing protein [Ralstonia pseudosolanacearum]|uniref:DUF3617 domain-containing protein n=1 Tax=Ralstonia pseudosolanacearum TaxID=1310165 RepID=UPI0013159316|nr:DUF3617 family protein [Ralstonia pseudosolanacearum]
MRWIHTRSALWLAMAVQASAFAQAPVKAGKWELTSTFKGVPFGGDAERVRTACLSDATLGPIPEKALIEAAPPPSDDASAPAPPKCEYTQVHRDGAKSSWQVSCVSPTMTGTGSMTITPPGQVDLLETLEMKTAFGSRSIQHTVRAHRLGDCS